MTKVNYLTLRVLAGFCLALGLSLAGCLTGAGRAEVVSPFSGKEEGPRSYNGITQEISKQSDDVRKLFLQAQGLYPYLQNSYRVQLRIEKSGKVSKVDLLDREYVIPDFEREFLRKVRAFRFSKYNGAPVEIVYTFSFFPERIMPPKAPIVANPPASEDSQKTAATAPPPPVEPAAPLAPSSHESPPVEAAVPPEKMVEPSPLPVESGAAEPPPEEAAVPPEKFIEPETPPAPPQEPAPVEASTPPPPSDSPPAENTPPGPEQIEEASHEPVPVAEPAAPPSAAPADGEPAGEPKAAAIPPEDAEAKIADQPTDTAPSEASLQAAPAEESAPADAMGAATPAEEEPKNESAGESQHEEPEASPESDINAQPDAGAIPSNEAPPELQEFDENVTEFPPEEPGTPAEVNPAEPTVPESPPENP